MCWYVCAFIVVNLVEWESDHHTQYSSQNYFLERAQTKCETEKLKFNKIDMKAEYNKTKYSKQMAHSRTDKPNINFVENISG